jgi:hypothetical protein
MRCSLPRFAGPLFAAMLGLRTTAGLAATEGVDGAPRRVVRAFTLKRAHAGALTKLLLRVFPELDIQTAEQGTLRGAQTEREWLTQQFRHGMLLFRGDAGTVEQATQVASALDGDRRSVQVEMEVLRVERRAFEQLPTANVEELRRKGMLSDRPADTMIMQLRRMDPARVRPVETAAVEIEAGETTTVELCSSPGSPAEAVRIQFEPGDLGISYVLPFSVHAGRPNRFGLVGWGSRFGLYFADRGTCLVRLGGSDREPSELLLVIRCVGAPFEVSAGINAVRVGTRAGDWCDRQERCKEDGMFAVAATVQQAFPGVLAGGGWACGPRSSTFTHLHGPASLVERAAALVRALDAPPLALSGDVRVFAISDRLFESFGKGLAMLPATGSIQGADAEKLAVELQALSSRTPDADASTSGTRPAVPADSRRALLLASGCLRAPVGQSSEVVLEASRWTVYRSFLVSASPRQLSDGLRAETTVIAGERSKHGYSGLAGFYCLRGLDDNSTRILLLRSAEAKAPHLCVVLRLRCEQ